MWYIMIRPVLASVEVPDPVDDVYDFLDVMANHEQFTNHMLRDWEYSGPERGVGAQARVRVSAAGRTEVVDLEVVAAERPRQITERNVGAHGRRRATGTYTLEPLAGGGTRIAFRYAWLQAPLAERVAAPLVRSFVRRGNERAMQRLAETLRARAAAAPVA
jgi:carbon monoxide dehydrogenase subunit G